jgi:DNA-binding transcriptional MerR regulator
MAPKARIQKRLYYKIGEACKALGIQPYVLRYWETEFPALSPSKSRSGQRVYSEKELEIIRRIKQLLYDEGYTIAGAKKKLEGELAAGTLGESATATQTSFATSPPAAASAVGLSAAPAEAALAERGEAAPARPAAKETSLPLPLRQPSPARAAVGTRRAGTAADSGDRPVPMDAGALASATLPSLRGVSPLAEGPRPSSEEPPTLPLEPALPLAPAGSMSREPSTEPGADPGARRDAGSVAAVSEPDPGAGRGETPPAAAASELDTGAAKQIETLRKGIYKALQEAREILALLDRSPQ